MNNDHDHDRDRDHAANDNGKQEGPGDKQVTPAPAGDALASIAALATAFANVPTATYIGRTVCRCCCSRAEKKAALGRSGRSA